MLLVIIAYVTISVSEGLSRKILFTATVSSRRLFFFLRAVLEGSVPVLKLQYWKECLLDRFVALRELAGIRLLHCRVRLSP